MARTILLFTLATIFASGCLPVDTRPPPGRALITVSSDDTSNGFSTDDGWLVRYDRQLVSLGNVGVVEGPCELYAESHYVRILDLSRTVPQTLAELYALGTCPVIFEVRAPPSTVVLGAGVDPDDEGFMQAPGKNPYVRDLGVALHLSGSATRGESTLRFAWSFRDNLIYGPVDDCGSTSFTSEASTTLAVRVRTADLFSDPVLARGVSGSHFDLFAAADANADDEITLEELDAVPLDAAPQDPLPNEGGGSWTFGKWFYRRTAAELFSINDIPCKPGRFMED
jgi:hypothetical protein